MGGSELCCVSVDELSNLEVGCEMRARVKESEARLQWAMMFHFESKPLLLTSEETIGTPVSKLMIVYNQRTEQSRFETTNKHKVPVSVRLTQTSSFQA